MAIMTDTEGAELPGNGRDDDVCWDINLWGDGCCLLSIPMLMDCGDGGLYNGAGVASVDLRDLLQEYLDDHKRLDDGDGLLPLAKMFREFADKYEEAALPSN